MAAVRLLQQLVVAKLLINEGKISLGKARRQQCQKQSGQYEDSWL